MPHPTKQTVLAFLGENETLTAREARQMGIHSQTLSRLNEAGQIERVARGQYRLANHDVTEHHSLAIVGAAVPSSVICLLSALSFHGIGTALPSEVWLAIRRGSRPPTLKWPPLRVFHFAEAAHESGVRVHSIEGVPVKIYSPAKTVADLFKFRNRVGLDVAIEALRATWREGAASVDELTRFGRICRVERVMHPYLEATLL